MTSLAGRTQCLGWIKSALSVFGGRRENHAISFLQLMVTKMKFAQSIAEGMIEVVRAQSLLGYI